MAQGTRQSGKVRKIFYTIMNTPTSLRETDNKNKQNRKKSIRESYLNTTH